MLIGPRKSHVQSRSRNVPLVPGEKVRRRQRLRLEPLLPTLQPHRRAQVMSRLAFQTTSPFTMGTTFFKRWTPTLSIWGLGAGAAALFLLSVTPVVKNGALVKVPLLGSYYEDKTPASDKPF
ncbi:hypothetical protein JVU11DRAFT_363 [Chiua virens]|nr:hypothetical protein JVU11DRAFT_363 [Chiua virens]